MASLSLLSWSPAVLGVHGAQDPVTSLSPSPSLAWAPCDRMGRPALRSPRGGTGCPSEVHLKPAPRLTVLLPTPNDCAPPSSAPGWAGLRGPWEWGAAPNRPCRCGHPAPSVPRSGTSIVCPLTPSFFCSVAQPAGSSCRWSFSLGPLKASPPEEGPHLASAMTLGWAKRAPGRPCTAPAEAPDPLGPRPQRAARAGAGAGVGAGSGARVSPAGTD